jgi:hypothetical protein
MKVIGKAAISLCLVMCAAKPLMGQSIHGRVLVEGDTIGVGGTELALLNSTGTSLFRVQSDSLGMFRIPVPGPGKYEVLATRLGFASVRAEVEVREREIVDVELRMAEEAIPLDPIVVVARREIRRGTLDEFYDRMDRNKQRGVGWFFAREEIERRERVQLPILLQTAPGVFLQSSAGPPLMRHMGGYCSPVIVIDGLETSYRELQLMDLEGIEVYRGRFENVEGYFPSDCGMIFLWRRPDWGNPFSWGTLAVAGGLLALLIALASVF